MAPRDQRCEKARDVSYGDASYWGRRLGLARHVFSRTGVLGVCFVMTDMTMHGRVVSRDIVTSVYCALGPGIEHLQRWSSLSYKLLLDAYNVYIHSSGKAPEGEGLIILVRSDLLFAEVP